MSRRPLLRSPALPLAPALAVAGVPGAERAIAQSPARPALDDNSYGSRANAAGEGAGRATSAASGPAPRGVPNAWPIAGRRRARVRADRPRLRGRCPGLIAPDAPLVAGDVGAAGPAYRAHGVRAGRVVVSLTDVGRGPMARGGGPVQGFAVAGADRRFVWANAEIEGERAVVWSARVAAPVAARHAWGNDPAGADPFNLDGLPAAPFRTDAW